MKTACPIDRYTLADVDRFWSKVNKNGECWLWTGLVQFGYGVFTLWDPVTKRAQKVKAHRLAYTVAVGPVPVELTLDHLCRNRGCVRPSHLEIVTNGENIRRGNPSWKQKAARLECPEGHEFDAANTGRKPDGSRRCRACDRATRRRYVARHAA